MIQQIFPPLFTGTKGISKKNKFTAFLGGSLLSCIICSTLFLVVALCGTISFDNPKSNILNAFSNPCPNASTDWVITVCRILMIIVVLVSYPAIIFPVTSSLIRYIPKKWKISKIWKGRFIMILMRLCLDNFYWINK